MKKKFIAAILFASLFITANTVWATNVYQNDKTPTKVENTADAKAAKKEADKAKKEAKAAKKKAVQAKKAAKAAKKKAAQAKKAAKAEKKIADQAKKTAN